MKLVKEKSYAEILQEVKRERKYKIKHKLKLILLFLLTGF